MNANNFLGELQKTCSKSKALTKVALKVRNQCDAVIANYIGKTNEGTESGEHWFLKKYVGSGPATLFDVGANRGDWTRAAKRINEEVTIFSYEPDPRVAPQYRASVPAEEKITFHELALGKDTGELSFFLSEDSTELSTADPIPGGRYESLSVNVSTLDNEVERYDIDCIDLLKIDVEGHESAVLQGATDVLSSGRVGCIQFEYGRNWMTAGATLTNVCMTLQAHDFHVFLLRPNCLMKINLSSIGEYFSYSNFIAVHEHEMSEIGPLVAQNSLFG